MNKSNAYILLASTCLVALSGCSGNSVKETLGMTRRAPDEFKVVSRPPLTVPPQFQLRPPSNSAQSPTVVPADKQAQSIIVGESSRGGDENFFDLKEGAVDTAVTPVEASNLPSAKDKKGEKAKTSADSSQKSGFMENIGVAKADPTVRDTLVQQKIEAQEKKEEASWWDVFSSKPEKKDPLVNAKEEAERIKNNKAGGKPITEGQTPEVKDKDRGLLGDLLGL